MNAIHQKEVIMNAIMVFHSLVDEYIDFACLTVNPEIKDRAKESFLDRIVNASIIHSEDAASVKKAVTKTIDIMRDIEIVKTGNMEAYVQRRRVLSEIPSILHISSAYPQSAISRLNKLAKKI